MLISKTQLIFIVMASYCCNKQGKNCHDSSRLKLLSIFGRNKKTSSKFANSLIRKYYLTRHTK